LLPRCYVLLPLHVDFVPDAVRYTFARCAYVYVPFVVTPHALTFAILSVTLPLHGSFVVRCAFYVCVCVALRYGTRARCYVVTLRSIWFVTVAFALPLPVTRCHTFDTLRFVAVVDHVVAHPTRCHVVRLFCPALLFVVYVAICAAAVVVYAFPLPFTFVYVTDVDCRYAFTLFAIYRLRLIRCCCALRYTVGCCVTFTARAVCLPLPLYAFTCVPVVCYVYVVRVPGSLILRFTRVVCYVYVVAALPPFAFTHVVVRPFTFTARCYTFTLR